MRKYICKNWLFLGMFFVNNMFFKYILILNINDINMYETSNIN